MRTVPPRARRGFTLRAQHAQRATARAIRPAQSAQRVRFACSKCAPRHSESDLTPKVRRGFASHAQNARRATARASPSQNVHRATARAIRPTQSAQRVRFAFSKCAPRRSLSQFDAPATKSTHRRQSTAHATKFARKAPKCRACHETQAKRSKVLRLPRKASLPQTQNHPDCWTCHEIQL